MTSQSANLPYDEVSGATAKVADLKVLCVDDDPDVVRGLARNFKKHGITPLTAYHGMQGYYLACTEHPDVIVIDLKMPRGNGDYVIQCLRQNLQTARIPIIVLSGVKIEGVKKHVENEGADRFLAKPVEFVKLLEVVKELAG